jgi:hypothetical protein
MSVYMTPPNPARLEFAPSYPGTESRGGKTRPPTTPGPSFDTTMFSSQRRPSGVPGQPPGLNDSFEDLFVIDTPNRPYVQQNPVGTCVQEKLCYLRMSSNSIKLPRPGHRKRCVLASTVPQGIPNTIDWATRAFMRMECMER